MQEIIEATQNTLNHQIIGRLYLFCQDLRLVPHMTKQILNNSHKMTFVPNMEDNMASLFRYANEHLENHVVMVMNADVYPGEGFEKLDFDYLRNNKAMYGLSR